MYLGIMTPAVAFLIIVVALVSFPCAIAFNPRCWNDRKGEQIQSCDDLHRGASRLTHNDAAFADTKEVGLGGGIEYSYEKGFCRKMQHALNMPVTCAQPVHKLLQNHLLP